MGMDGRFVKQSNPLTVLLGNEQADWNLTRRGLLEALQLLESTSVDVAVLDAQMPQLGGLQIIRLLRELDKSTPAILLTSHLTSHLLQEALGMQVFSVLSKPVDLNVLLDALARVLRRYHENRWPGDEGNVG